MSFYQAASQESESGLQPTVDGDRQRKVDVHHDDEENGETDYGEDISELILQLRDDDPQPLSEAETDYGDDLSAIQNYEDLRECHPTSAAPVTQLPLVPANSTQSDANESSQSSIRLGKRKASDISDAGSTQSTKPTKSYRSDPDIFDPEKPYIIAHDPAVEEMMNQKGIKLGVAYEIARLISRDYITNDNITSAELDVLQGKNSEAAPKVLNALKGPSSAEAKTLESHPAFLREKAAKVPWSELDVEEEVLAKDQFGGLGNNPEYPGWYGGKIEFRAKLEKLGTKQYKIVLEDCILGASCRFTRRFGSWSFLRIKVPLDIFHESDNGLGLFFKRPFVLWGRVFKTFYAKDQTVFLFKTNEACPSLDSRGSNLPGLSLQEFLMWHNPLQENSQQSMTKWAARTVLGLSNSVPGPRIPQENIGFEDDVVSLKGSDMTDGCGYSNKPVHLFLLHQLNLDLLPSAFQFRFAGCKGMSLIREDEQPMDNERRIWFRPSQTKIKYPAGQPLDPAMLTIDLLRTSRLRTPARLSPETIINLHENGVPEDVFLDLMKESIQEMVTSLTTWEGPNAMFHLWANVERAGGVFAGRRAREAVGEARARGYSNRSPDEEEDEQADEDELDSGKNYRSTPWWGDQISGCPSTLEETIMVLLDSGFTPQTSPILREKLKQCITKKVENRSSNIRFEVKQSASAFVVPDPYGVLGPDEIQIKSSHRNLVGIDGLETDIILGDVLITRNPCKVPTDVRKVKAVEHPLLRNFLDVIVCSIQGLRRLLDFLAGGDYDGDKALVIWFVLIVSSFEIPDEKHSYEPKNIHQAFTQEKETGSEFLQRTRSMTPSSVMLEMQNYLLGALRDTSLVGQYSTMHDNAIYQLGYAHPRTVKLAYKFCKVLDSPKTGWKIKPETIKGDKREYYHPRGPQWKAADKKKKKRGSKIDTTNLPYLQRRQDSPYVHGEFIMDILRIMAKKETDGLLADVEALFSKFKVEDDDNIAAPWNNAVAWAERGDDLRIIRSKRKDLAIISQHVQHMFKTHGRMLRGVGKHSSFTERNISDRQDVLRALSLEFSSSPKLEDVPTIIDEDTLSRLRASYAYIYDREQCSGKEGWSRFPWNMATRELCTIKAKALGPYKTVTDDFYQQLRLKTGWSHRPLLLSITDPKDS